MRMALALLAGMVLTAGAAQPSFKRDIAPLLRTRCASCHLTGNEPGKMQLHPAAAYASLVDAPAVGAKLLRVKPGNPDQSYLVMKIEGTHLDKGGTGARMPIGSAPLDPAARAKIRSWIAAGAKDN